MGKIYSSKKPGKSDVKAELVKAPNENTVILKYLTGEHKDKTVTITTGTLKRYWREETETTPKKTATEILGIDMDEVNKPYKPDVKPHYIPKPESVKEYEENKRKKHNFDLPEFDSIVEQIGFICCKVNTNYVKLNDKASTVWRYAGYIACYCTEEVWQSLTKAGLQSQPNKDKYRPFGFIIKNKGDYDKLIETLVNHFKED